MRSLALLVLCSILLAAAGTAGVIQSDLEAQLSASAPNEMIHVMITMQEQGDSDWLMRNAADLDRRAAREFVVDYLSEIADRTQADVKAYLQSKLAVGQVKNLQSVFIVNLLHCYATPEVIRGLEKFSEIAEVSYDPERYLLAGVESFPQIPAIPAEVDEIAWGVADINAPAVWAMGYNGTGVIVSVTDTGVNYNHVDLADHMWNGGPQYPNHGYDFYSNDNDPMDNGPLGHGTHVAGTVASDGTAGSQCGVAPNAIIMAVKVLSGGGNGTEGMSISGINFTVQQGADIFSMSLGWQTTSQRAQFRTACNNALAAGVIGAIAAGNEGNSQSFYPIPGNVRTPGDVPPPWLHPNQTLIGGLSCVVTCGATNSAHVLAGFSSRGPVSWSSIAPWNDYAYNPGMGLIDPDVSAPGVNVKSCAWNNINGYLDGWEGTSMATPHVSGTLALMLDKNPNVTPRQLDSLIEITALDWGTAGKDNNYGAGRIEAYAAVSATPGGGPPPNVTVTLLPVNPPIIIPAQGGTFQWDITLHNGEATSQSIDIWNVISGPIVRPGWGPYLNLTMSAGQTINRIRPQTIPASFPAGSYTYTSNIGDYPGAVWDSDSFPWTKAAAGDGGWASNESSAGLMPAEYALHGAIPNPFNPTTTLSFALPQAGPVKLSVYNVTGREVATLVNGWRDAGNHEVTFDASDLASGLYVYQLTAGDFHATGKMVLMK